MPPPLRPRLTIISAYHKRAEAVRVTLEALVAQQYDDWQALVWDDGSGDDTYETLQKLQAELGDDRIHVFAHDPNIGFTRGMNHAIEISDSEFVAVVGSGDGFAPERMTRQIAALEANPEAVFCSTAAVSIDPETGARFRDNTFDGTRLEARDLYHSCPFTHGAIMFRRATLERVGLYEPAFTWGSDWDLCNRALAGGRHAIHIPEPLYHRYARADGASFSPKKSVLQVKCAHLAHRLRRAPDQRETLLAQVRREGIDAVLTDRRHQLATDLYTRQAKLYILGRKAQGDELGALIAPDFPPRGMWRAVLGALRMAAPLPLVRLYGLAHKANQTRKTLRAP